MNLPSSPGKTVGLTFELTSQIGLAIHLSSRPFLGGGGTKTGLERAGEVIVWVGTGGSHKLVSAAVREMSPRFLSFQSITFCANLFSENTREPR